MRKPEVIHELDSFLRNNTQGKKITVITHWGGDADSIGAAYVLIRLLEKHYGASSVSLIIPETLTTHSRAILSKLNLEPANDIGDADVFILIDVGSLEQVGKYLDTVLEKGKKALIDHHLHKTYDERIRYVVSDEYQSTSEIIYDLAAHIGWRFSKEEAEALFMGIYYDTARLSVADRESLSKICSLTSLGVEPTQVLMGLETQVDESERIARLKAATRMSIYRVGEWIIATSNVSAFQTSAARALLGLGAHVAVVAGEDEEEETVSISLRAQQDFVRKTSINMGRVLVDVICGKYGGTGGGHATVARVKCKGEIDEILSFIIRQIGQMLSSEVKRVS